MEQVEPQVNVQRGSLPHHPSSQASSRSHLHNITLHGDDRHPALPECRHTLYSLPLDPGQRMEMKERS